MHELLLFLLTFTFIFIIYNIFIVSKTKKRKAKDINSKDPVEISYLINRYHLDMKKIRYERLLALCAFVSSFDIALIVSISSISNNMYIELLIAFISSIVVILISYHLVYIFYKKKGMIKNV